MCTSLSFEGRARTFMKDFDISLDVFTTLALLEGLGVGRTTIGDALRGRNSLPNEVTQRLEPLLTDLKRLCAAIAPLRVNFANGVEVKHCLDLYRAGRLKIEVTTLDQ